MATSAGLKAASVLLSQIQIIIFLNYGCHLHTVFIRQNWLQLLPYEMDIIPVLEISAIAISSVIPIAPYEQPGNI